MRTLSWIVGCLLLFVAGTVFGIYLDATFGPSHILLQAQPNTKVNVVPKGGDVVEWTGADGKPLPVKFAQGAQYFPCEEQEKQEGNSTCTLRVPAKTTSFTYNCDGCFDPTLGPVSGKSPGGHSFIGGSVIKLDDVFVDLQGPQSAGGVGGWVPIGSEPPPATGLPVDVAVTCDAASNVVVSEGGSSVKTISVKPEDSLELTGFSDLKANPPNPVSGQPLCSKGNLNFANACVIGSPGTYAVTISASECTGSSWAHSVTVTGP